MWLWVFWIRHISWMIPLQLHQNLMPNCDQTFACIHFSQEQHTSRDEGTLLCPWSVSGLLLIFHYFPFHNGKRKLCFICFCWCNKRLTCLTVIISKEDSCSCQFPLFISIFCYAHKIKCQTRVIAPVSIMLMSLNRKKNVTLQKLGKKTIQLKNSFIW